MNILWAIIALIALGLVAAIIGYIQHLYRQRRIALGLETEGEDEIPQPVAGGCCGMHSTCERDSLLAAVSTSIVYYDDEELDRYRGLSASQYTDEGIEEFRDVLVTLEEDDVAGWVRSLQHRGIAFPEELLPELYLIIGENRAHHMKHGPGDRH